MLNRQVSAYWKCPHPGTKLRDKVNGSLGSLLVGTGT